MFLVIGLMFFVLLISVVLEVVLLPVPFDPLYHDMEDVLGNCQPGPDLGIESGLVVPFQAAELRKDPVKIEMIDISIGIDHDLKIECQQRFAEE